MKFGEFPVLEAVDICLAHSRAVGDRRFKKGHRLTAADCRQLADAGIPAIIGARLDHDDLDENTAATRIAALLTNDGLTAGRAGTGRCNLYAASAGLVALDTEKIAAFNGLDEAVTLSTVAAHHRVAAGQIVATVKIIPFAVSQQVMTALTDLTTSQPPLVQINGFQPIDARLLHTQLPHTSDALIAKAGMAMRQRLQALGGTLIAESQCSHAQDAVTHAIREQIAAAPDILFIMGASAIVDRQDIIPQALVAAGGTILRFGLPVDPGNLTLIGRLGKIWVIGVPGSARSPRLHGFDWLLERIAAGLPIDTDYLSRLGAGGLMKEMPDRPVRRRAAAPANIDASPDRISTIAAVLLAAGSSRRMGKANKLTQSIDGVAMVRRVANTLRTGGIERLLAVTGHEQAPVEAALAGLPVDFIHNPDYASGQGSSVAAGVRAARDQNMGAVLIALGDMPAIAPETIRTLHAAWQDAEDPDHTIIVPTHQGRRGNPVLWGRGFFDALTALTGDQGARHLFDDHADAIQRIDVPDPGICLDLDTPEALAGFSTRLGDTI